MLQNSYRGCVASAIFILQKKVREQKALTSEKPAVQGFLIHFVWYGYDSSLAQRMKRRDTLLAECSHLICKNVTN